MQRNMFLMAFLMCLSSMAYSIDVNVSCSQPWAWVFVANDKYFIESYSAHDGSFRHEGKKEYFERFKDNRFIRPNVSHFIDFSYEKVVIHEKRDWEEKARKPTKEFVRVSGGKTITFYSASFDGDGFLVSSDKKTLIHCITNADPRIK